MVEKICVMNFSKFRQMAILAVFDGYFGYFTKKPPWYICQLYLIFYLTPSGMMSYMWFHRKLFLNPEIILPLLCLGSNAGFKSVTVFGFWYWVKKCPWIEDDALSFIHEFQTDFKMIFQGYNFPENLKERLFGWDFVGKIRFGAISAQKKRVMCGNHQALCWNLYNSKHDLLMSVQFWKIWTLIRGVSKGSGKSQHYLFYWENDS